MQRRKDFVDRRHTGSLTPTKDPAQDPIYIIGWLLYRVSCFKQYALSGIFGKKFMPTTNWLRELLQNPANRRCLHHLSRCIRPIYIIGWLLYRVSCFKQYALSGIFGKKFMPTTNWLRELLQNPANRRCLHHLSRCIRHIGRCIRHIGRCLHHLSRCRRHRTTSRCHLGFLLAPREAP